MRGVANTRVALLALLALAATGGIDRKAARLNRDANQRYTDKQYEEAAALYEDAHTRAPESPEIAYNLGNNLLRQGKAAEAVPHLRRAAESAVEPPLRARSLYNLGNALHGMGNLKEAVTSYRRALDLSPGDLDTKINYEKALRELQEQQQQQQQPQKQRGKGENSDQKQESQPDRQDPQNEKDENAQQQQASQQPSENPQEQEPEGRQGEPQPSEAEQRRAEEQRAAAIDSAVAAGDLRPEEALRILEAMREQEKELQKEKARQARAKARRVDKDW